MGKAKYSYRIQIQYLGYRFHGWAKQTGMKTVHGMVDKTVAFVLQHDRFKTMGGSRTDAMVSADQFYVVLFVDDPLQTDQFLTSFNQNLPYDIRALAVEPVDGNFNIIQSSIEKEYNYLFTFGEKPHPFCSSIMSFFSGELDVDLMKEGAALLKERTIFRKFCSQPGKHQTYTRTVSLSEIEKNETFTANFFPEQSFLYRVVASGFLRNQVRLMMGQLVELGRHHIELEDLVSFLQSPDSEHFRFIAPASGLILKKQTYSDNS